MNNPGGSQTSPFSVLAWLGIPNPQEFVGFIFPLSVFGHPLQALSLSCCFQDAAHLLWDSQASPAEGDGAMDSAISSHERPLGT